jgi:hypothetical protein
MVARLLRVILQSKNETFGQIGRILNSKLLFFEFKYLDVVLSYLLSKFFIALKIVSAIGGVQNIMLLICNQSTYIKMMVSCI